MRKYKIVCNDAAAQADSYAVVYVPGGEVVSHHDSRTEAGAAARRYESADAKRRYLNGLPSGPDPL